MAAPAITVQPSNQVANAPARPIFSLTATSDAGALTYQWKKSTDGSTYTDIAGATSSSYTGPIPLSGDNPTLYKCTVTNDDGSTDSNAVQVQSMRVARQGKITNLDINSSEIIALLDVGGCKSLWMEFLVSVANLSAFTVEYQLYGAGGWMLVASAGADYTTPNYPVNKASGALPTAAAGSTTHWISLNVEGVSFVRLKAAGTNSKIAGGYRAG